MKKLLPNKLLTTITLSLTLLFTTSISSILASTSTTNATNTNTTLTVQRLSGVDRYATSASIAKQGWSNGSDYAILAFGGNFPDSLSATPLAKKYDAPILLTESASLTPITKQTLIDLKTKTVFIIGGTGVLSASIDAELQSMGINVQRIFGIDKYETSIAIANQITSVPSEVFVVNGDDFSDGLSISPIASIKQMPIILVSNDNMPSSVKDYIDKNSSNIKTSYAIGYSDVIGDGIVNQFPNPQRILGSDRYSRNTAINQKFNSLFNKNINTVCSGEQFPDVLAGSALASKLSTPIIMVNNSTPNDTKKYYIQRLGNTDADANLYIFGGTAVVPDSVIQGLNSITSSDTVTPTTPIIPTPTTTPTPTSPTFDSTSQSSRTNPYPLNVPQNLTVDNIFDNYSAQFTVKQIIRGAEAWNMIYKKNKFNDEPKDGYEYILAKINVKVLDIADNDALILRGNSFELVSQDGKVYDSCIIVVPDPKLDAKLYNGASNEGWAAFMVKKDDLKPVISYGVKYDGSGGILFKGYGDGTSISALSTTVDLNENTMPTNISDLESNNQAKIGAPVGSIICPSGLGFNKNSADGIKVYWLAKNQTGKTINYYTVNISMYNPVGDPAYDEIKNISNVLVKYVGPVKPDENLAIYSIIAYSPVCSKIVIDSIYLEYSDGTFETIPYGKSGTNTLVK